MVSRKPASAESVAAMPEGAAGMTPIVDTGATPP
jgi:hypothetical protein